MLTSSADSFFNNPIKRTQQVQGDLTLAHSSKHPNRVLYNKNQAQGDLRMGNCQAAEVASAAVIQHPDGRIERLYWPTTVEEVTKRNPEHHVALVTRFISQQRKQRESSDGGYVRVTRVRLLRRTDVLLFGQVYRLIDSREVSEALKARKLDKVRRSQSESVKKQRQQLQSCEVDQESVEFGEGEGRIESERLVDQQVEKQEGDRQRSTRARHWRPTLQSISESVS